MQVRRRTIALWIGLVMAGALTGCTVDPGLYQERGLRNYYELHRVEAARADFQRAIKGKPTLWQSQYHLGLIALSHNEPMLAQRHLEIALTLVRDQPAQAQPIVDALAEAMYQQGDYPRLFGFLNEVTDQYGTANDYLRRARYFVKVGDHDNAQVAFRQAIKVAGPGEVEPYLALAGFYEQIGATDKALVVLRQAYGLAPDNAQVAQAIRRLGEIPGPTISLPPDR